MRDLSFSFYNSLALLFCEMDRRFYGGGVLELTPKKFWGVPIHYQRPTESQFYEFIRKFPKSKSPEAANFELADCRLANELSLSEKQAHMIQKALRSVRTHRLRHGTSQRV